MKIRSTIDESRVIVYNISGMRTIYIDASAIVPQQHNTGKEKFNPYPAVKPMSTAAHHYSFCG